MAIGKISSAAAHLYGVNSKIKKVESKGSHAISPRKEDVKLSDEGKEAAEQVKYLEEIVKNQPEIRIPLVEELQAKIRSNDYPIEQNLNEIVRRMIRGDSSFSEVA